MIKPKKVAVIGGGVIGICTAYFLLKAQHEVVVIDKGEVGSGCSFGNSGFIVPSHIVPLAAPGIVPQAVRWLFNMRSPFYIKPRLDRHLLQWLWRFYLSATHSHMMNSLVLLRDLNLMSKALFHRFYEEGDFQFPLTEKGILVVYNTSQRGHFEQKVAALANQNKVNARLLNTAQVVEMLGGIKADVLGGVYYDQDAHFHPVRFVQNMAQYLEKQGVEILRYTEVLGLEEKNHFLQGLITSEGEIFADEFVLACGANSAELIRELEIDIPLEAGKGYSVTIESPSVMPEIPAILAEARVAVTPMDGELRLAGTMELSGQDLSINHSRVEEILLSAGRYLPDLKGMEKETDRVWSGLRPCSPDGLPYIGRLRKIPNLIAATGHAMMGMSLGPVTGKLVNEIVSEQPACLDISALSPDRFS